MKKILLLATILLTLSACGDGGNGGSGGGTPPLDPNRSLAPGDYDITTNPFNLDPDLPDFTHQGNMLVANQDGTSQRFWCQLVEVQPQTMYAFSAQGRSLSSTLVEIQWDIDGGVLLTQTLPQDRFVTMTAHWDSEDRTQIQLCGRNLTTDHDRAFAIDNIRLVGPGSNCDGDFDPNPSPDPVANSCYADSVVAHTQQRVNAPDLVLGPPTRSHSGTTDFDNEGSTPGSVVVALSERAQDGAGDDILIWLDGNQTHGRAGNYEGFKLYASDGGTNFVQVGNTYLATSSDFDGAVGFDLSGSGLSGATHIKIENDQVYASDQDEGPDIDAIEGVYCQ